MMVMGLHGGGSELTSETGTKPIFPSEPPPNKAVTRVRNAHVLKYIKRAKTIREGKKITTIAKKKIKPTTKNG